MNEKTKNVLLSVLVVGLVSMTVAYAALSQTLNINGSATVQNISNSWKVRFQPLATNNLACPSGTTGIAGSSICTKGYATADTFTVSTDSTSVTLPTVTLKAPGDQIVYRWTVQNSGDIDAEVTAVPSFTPTFTYNGSESLTSEQRTAFESKISVSATYADGTAIAVGNTLASGATRDIMVTITFDSSATTLPSHDVTIGGITATLVYGQA